jgi:hypothetical protein
MPKSSYRGANRSISTSSKQVDAESKAVSSNQPTSSIAATQCKTSKIECFKCGGHGHKQAECPNRHTMISLVDGSYDSQSEEEDECSIPKIQILKFPQTRPKFKMNFKFHFKMFVCELI